MDFNFSDSWEWFFGIVGLLGLGGVVAIFRAIFGKPKLVFKFRLIDGNTGDSVKQQLVCSLWNSPFRNRVMKVLFVPRPRIDDVSVRCEVLIRDTIPARRVGTTFWADMVTTDKEAKKHLSLPASVLPVEFFVLTSFKAFKGAWLQNAQIGDAPVVGGVYVARVIAHLGDKVVSAQQEFIVVDNNIVLGKGVIRHGV